MVLKNPYLERFEALHNDFPGQHGNIHDMSTEQLKHWLDNQLKLGVCRDDMVHLYSFAIPNDEALDALADHGPILEIGAGNGYWASLMRQKGIDVIALDLYPPPHPKNNYFRGDPWTDIEQGGAEESEHHSNRTLFLCWPDLDDPWAYNALSCYTGNQVAYVGAGFGGCTADDAFHEKLDEEWEETVVVNIPQWTALHDSLRFYERKVPKVGR
jgi:hypothetical protein